MLFNSLHFLYFFVAVFFLYFKVIPDKYRWALLLVSSCYFYAVYIPKFILILFFLITIDYFLGLSIHKTSGKQRKTLLIISICANIGTLFLFKYFNFFNENIASLAQLIHWNYSPLLLQIALPLGLSFHVFQSLSYVIEVYKGKQIPERHYGIYALYVMFFPQLVAGPIERPQHLLHQFHQRHDFNAIFVRRGLERMLIGFFKKLVIADWIAVIVTHVYNNASDASGLTLLFAAILFSYQIYCDFSGYSDIAVGAALVFGYDLTENFNRPYASRSIPEFWRRWHISLSNWLRDYLYYPLAFAGKQVTKVRLYVSLVITFTLIGLWHGANWTYVLFGLYHGVLSVLSLLTERIRKAMYQIIRLEGTLLQSIWKTMFTFILVTISFIFFRSENVTQSVDIIAKIITSLPDSLQGSRSFSEAFSFESLGLTHARVSAIILAICFIECVQYLQTKRSTLFLFEKRNTILRWGWYYLLTFSILFFGYLDAQSFIYFKF